MSYCTDTPTRCTSGPAKGAVALAAYLVARFGIANWGIFNCRNVRGGVTLSLHGEGRAFDAGTVRVTAEGKAIAALMVAHAEALGVQEVIYDRRIWTAERADEGWRPYTGENPHTDHVHIGLCRRYAASLTLAKITDVLEEDDMPDQQYFDRKFAATVKATNEAKGRLYARMQEQTAKVIAAVKDDADLSEEDIRRLLADGDKTLSRQIVADLKPAIREVLSEIHGETITDTDAKLIAETVAKELAERLAA